MLNDGTGQFSQPPGASETFAWPTAEGDNMVCGVAIGDVNGDALPDIVIGQHYDAPWKQPVANRLYLNRGVSAGVPAFEDATESAGLLPLPLKAPHVELQDFDNDGRVDIYTSIVMFDGDRPHPVIFRNLGNDNGVPRFQQDALGVNDFPTAADKATKRSGDFFAKMIADRKVVYSAPGPSCDFDRDGRIDMVLPSWWPELPTILLKNETASGNWLEVQLAADAGSKVNSMGVGARIDIFEAGKEFQREFLIGSRELAVGFGYASGQEAVAHFGLGSRDRCDVLITLPHRQGVARLADVNSNQRVVKKLTQTDIAE
jgi:hypothetical protein